MPNIWEQLFSIAVIAVAMVFGGHLYRRRHDVPDSKKKNAPQASASKKRPRKKR